MKINLNSFVTDLDGTPINDANMGDIIANMLAQDKQGDALKFWDWATRLHRKETLDLDPSDKDKLLNFVKESQLPVITKAQIIHRFTQAEKEHEEFLKKPKEQPEKKKGA